MSKTTIFDFCSDKRYVLLFGGLSAVAAAYGIYKLLQRPRQPDEYFTTLKWQGGGTQRRILVLGLGGAGKSRLLQCFQQNSYPGNILPTPAPSIGYNIHSVGIGGVDYHFWEGSGTSNNSDVYFGVPSCIDMFIWMVDSSNPTSFAASKAALHSFLKACDNLELQDSKENSSLVGVPVVIVASKQDQAGSVPAAQVLQQMEASSLELKHKVYIIGMQLPDVGHRKGLWRLYELIAFAEQKRYKA